MPPTTVLLELGVGVRGVVDYEVRVRHQREHSGVRAPRLMLGVRDVRERYAAVLDAVAGRPIGMREALGANREPFSQLERGTCGYVPKRERCPECLERNRKVRRRHLRGQHGANAALPIRHMPRHDL